MRGLHIGHSRKARLMLPTVKPSPAHCHSEIPLARAFLSPLARLPDMRHASVAAVDLTLPRSACERDPAAWSAKRGHGTGASGRRGRWKCRSSCPDLSVKGGVEAIRPPYLSRLQSRRAQLAEAEAAGGMAGKIAQYRTPACYLAKQPP